MDYFNYLIDPRRDQITEVVFDEGSINVNVRTGSVESIYRFDSSMQLLSKDMLFPDSRIVREYYSLDVLSSKFVIVSIENMTVFSMSSFIQDQSRHDIMFLSLNDITYPVQFEVIRADAPIEIPAVLEVKLLSPIYFRHSVRTM